MKTVSFFSAGQTKRPVFFTFCFLLFTSITSAQNIEIYPPNWWVGMKHNQVQLLIFNNSDSNFSKQKLSSTYPGVTINKINKLDNGKFICADVTVAKTAKPGNAVFTFTGHGASQKVNWPVNARRTGMGKSYAQGVTSKDMVYFLMPDRFANGDTTNDIGTGLLEKTMAGN